VEISTLDTSNEFEEVFASLEAANEPPAAKKRKPITAISGGVTVSKPKETLLQKGARQYPVLKIYTDGSALANGAKGARAGVGVWFGDSDNR
jgi:predicted amidohydrolase YtcJ